MGWNSWNTFYDHVSEELICSTADAIVDSGLAEAGYEYVIIDDCWSRRTRDAEGRLVPDPDKFPNGIRAVAALITSNMTTVSIPRRFPPRCCTGG